MDRRQRKTREAIFHAFTQLLAEKDFAQITVGEIIQQADVGRATFYAHFETKDFLLKEYCEELFCHVFDACCEENDHHHIFNCHHSDPVFVHLFRHLQSNDNNILLLLSGRNNELFLPYFSDNLKELIQRRLSEFESKKKENIPEDFWTDHIVSTYIATLKWWISNGLKESPEVITGYFFTVV